MEDDVDDDGEGEEEEKCPELPRPEPMLLRGNSIYLLPHYFTAMDRIEKLTSPFVALEGEQSWSKRFREAHFAGN